MTHERTEPRRPGRIAAAAATLIGALALAGGCTGVEVDEPVGAGLLGAKPGGGGGGAIGAISCGSKYMNQSTAGSAYASYACAPGSTFGGTEWVRSLTAATSGDIVISAANFSWYPFITILRDTGAGVNTADCVTANYYAVRFAATAGEKFYVVVDQDGTVPSMSFDAQVSCSAGQTETACADGFDDDADFFVDCADDDCGADPACNLGTCTPYGTLACGDSLVPGSTDGFGSTNAITSYTCPADRVAGSPERAYTFTPTASGWVNFTLTNFAQYPMLFVLEDDGSGCNPSNCVAHNYYSVKFYATAGKTYYLVADGWGGTPYTFNASLVCDPPANEADCANSVDDDGDGVIDCADPDCAGTLACTNGQCSPVQTIDCATWLLHDDTAAAGSTSVISSYACAPGVDLNGPERAYKIGPVASGGKILVTTSNESTYGMISIVEDVGGVCSPANCIEEQYYSVQFTAQKGHTYYAIVEGDLGASVSYDLSVVCNPPASEAGLCFDGVDNDGDIPIDCADSDCAAECGACTAAESISPSTTLLPGTTSSASATNAIASYGCAPGASFPGNEYTYTFVATQTGPVNFALSDETDYGIVAVLEDTGSGCNPTSCVALQYYSVVANVTAGKTYYVVVDGQSAGSFDYKISVVANPPLSEAGLCGDNIDNDADFAIDCNDPDCACTP